MKEVKKPWGREKHFVENKKCTVKILEVNPKQKLSLQKHKKRAELWFFLTPGHIQIGSQKRKIKKGGLIKIPKNKPHGLISKNQQVKVLEISFGKFEQQDETRLEDKYGRK